MLVSGGVKDVVRAMELAEALERILLAEVGGFREDFQIGPGLAELAVEEVKPVLVDVDESEGRRAVGRDLSGELAADRSTRPRDQNPLARDQSLDLPSVERPRVTREQVLRGEIVEHGGVDAIVQVSEGNGNDLEVHFQARAEPQDRLDSLRGKPRDRDHR